MWDGEEDHEGKNQLLKQFKKHKIEKYNNIDSHNVAI
jgi:hypothetical protein